jgi:hypothetical protein
MRKEKMGHIQTAFENMMIHSRHGRAEFIYTVLPASCHVPYVVRNEGIVKNVRGKGVEWGSGAREQAYTGFINKQMSQRL